MTELECYEDFDNWKSIVEWFAWVVQGVSVSVVGLFGFGANVLSVIGKSNFQFRILPPNGALC